MSFETLQQRILQEAQGQAEDIVADLAEQTRREEVRIMNRAQAMEEEIIRQAEAAGGAKARRARQEAELSGRAAVLAAKQIELDTTKQALIEELLALDAKQTQNLLESLLELVPEEGTITPGEHHAAALKKLVKGKLTLQSHTISNEGGFLFQSPQTELNLTTTHLVNQLFNRYRAEIAQELFS